MKWVADKLSAGETVTFRPRGNSMIPLIKSGQEVTVAPITDAVKIEPDSIVLCRVKGRIYLHKVLAVGDNGFLIGNNRGHTNGWTRTLYGYLVSKGE
jgi:hypothetical protein